jgi:hypothetical protein
MFPPALLILTLSSYALGCMSAAKGALAMLAVVAGQ